jgi:WD40 repeat protein
MFSPTDITGIALSPDGQFLAAGWDDYSIKIWNLASGVAQNVLDDLRPKNGWYYLGDFTIAFSPDGRSLLMAGSNVVGVWELANTSLVNSATIKSEGMVDLDLSPDGEIIASVEGPNINLLKIADGSILSSDELMQSNTNVDFSPDGATLLTSMFDGTARLWPLSDQGIKKSFESESSVYTGGVAFSPDGQLLAVGSRHTGEIELRQVSDGSLLQTLFLDASAFVRSVDFSSDGNYLAVATVDRIRLFQLPDGKLLQTFSRGPSIAFSPDGTLLAGGSTDKAIMVWMVPGGKTLFTTEDGPDEVRAVAFSPDGRLLTAGYFDGTIEVFSALDGLSLKRWKGHSRIVSDLVFTPDGQQLISSSLDGTVRVWGLKP